MDEALLTIPDKLSPADSEWKIFDISQTQWMEKLSASKSILEKMKCDCHKSVCLDLPQCWKLGLTYTDVCKGTNICKYSTSNDTGNDEDVAVNNTESEIDDDEKDDNNNVHSEENDVKENKKEKLT